MLISHADVSQHVITHKGKRYLLYGIGEVMTLPTFQREGYGRRVVEAATASIHNSDADIGMLFTAPELEAFYSISGWTPLVKRRWMMCALPTAILISRRWTIRL